jgi:hypothetical protein
MSHDETNAFGAAALAMRRVSDEECNRWRLLSLVPSSLDHTIRNDDTVPYIMMLSMDMVMERRACLALAKRSTRT